MSRSGYSEDYDEPWQMAMWRGAVAKSIRGKRGQAFLAEMLAALDAMPEKRLIAHDLQVGGEVCAIGSVGAKRGVDMTTVDPEDYSTVAATFGIASALAQEIAYENDEVGCRDETPEMRWERVRKWVVSNIVAPEQRP